MTPSPSTQSSTTGTTLVFEDGERVYPCPCGETHRGPHAVYDYGHHTCPHDDGLWVSHEDGFALCRSCGKSFDLTNL